MGSETPPEYSVDEKILYFFHKPSATQSSCDAYIHRSSWGDMSSLLQSKAFAAIPFTRALTTSSWFSFGCNRTLPYEIYGSLVPSATFYGQIGEEGVDGKDPPRCILLDLAWKNSQDVNPSVREAMFQRYENDLRQLLAALPSRFHPVIQQYIGSLPAVFSLPMVLVHKHFGVNNVMVDADDNHHLVGVIDWAEAEIGPFGTNLHPLQQFMSKYGLRVGWVRHANYETLDRIFWNALSTSAGLDPESIQTIKEARIVGLLRSHGFTSRLANKPEPEPIRDNKSEAYKMLGLDGLLISPATKLVD
ncbi:unnamed protein product [Penicillium nalgiovense]|uniref:Aminoglycoside phosphotransferase domain-containing protein n=1 Tax=Penicillium nalgiovense TaxID=60175 RepID=A0A9W4HJ60_PENNA|nr:unnamed protein product [Penicillium nalgiovense]CAG7981490.1 unnamed protein product [Penicillium nalgiovense]CAG7990380.1 unnamed protein product [Penicillium nalgiovense]CAG8017789.1 unnamed protein product [Penicillium nalgiovense]CAG8032679.1 unnamed protein product [Penicillium nalgiovense]